MFEKNLIIIAGPTAVGKTAVSIELARKINGSIISADSQQVYREMTIGTAKPLPDEFGEVDYLGIDLYDFNEQFDAARFQVYADGEIEHLRNAGKPVIIAGGTGLYLKGLLEGIFEGPEISIEVREKIQQRIEDEGALKLHDELSGIDPEAADGIHPNDAYRIARALEVYEQTGKTISEFRLKSKVEQARYPYYFFVLNLERENLYQRIEERIDQMLEQGWVDEVKRLMKNGFSKESPACKALGYCNLVGYLNGEIDWDEAVRLIKRNTRRFAKRQLTWFRHVETSSWFDVGELNVDQVVKGMIDFMDGNEALR